MATTPTSKAARPWRLRAWTAEKELIHDQVHHGDAALNRAMHDLEDGGHAVRIAAGPA